MKRILFAVISATILFFACSKDDSESSSSYEEVSLSSVPTTVSAYINENYPDAAVSAVYKLYNSDTVYAVVLNTSEMLAFNGNGKPFGNGIPGLLCDSTGGFLNDSTGHHGHHGGGHHGGGHHGGGHHGGGHHGGVPVDSIPDAIAAWVSANYDGFTIHHVWNDTLCQFGNVYDVMIDSSRIAHKKLIFSLDGTFLALAHRMAYSDMPEAVASAVEAGFAGYEPRQKAEHFILADGTNQYKVFLMTETQKMCVVFDESGTLLCSGTH